MVEPEEPFRLRVYGKSELARLYFPNSRPATAMRNFQRWINHCPSIVQGLSELNHDKHRKYYLKPEVEVIIRGLGEP